MEKQNLESKRKIISIIGVFAIALIYVFAFFVYRQLIAGPEYQKQAIEQQTRENNIGSGRGMIYDRNGKILAQDSSVVTVTACPADVVKAGKVDEYAGKLAEILNLNRDDVAKKLNQNISHVEIAKKIEIEVADRIRAEKMKSIFLVDDTKRYYPYGSLASHVIGFTGTDNQGLSGVEMVYEKYLKGLPGRVISNRIDAGADMQPHRTVIM